jgi:hypothetical protein
MLRPDGKIQRCQYEVSHKDTYRYSGRGSSGFTMEYNNEQCSFKAVAEATNTYGDPIKLCSRHLKKVQYWCMTPTTYDQPWEPRKRNHVNI